MAHWEAITSMMRNIGTKGVPYGAVERSIFSGVKKEVAGKTVDQIID